MIKNSIFILFFLFFSCSSNKNNLDISNDELNFIKINIIELFSYNEEVEIQLQVKVPNNRLVFTKSAEGFTSELSINTIFTNADSKVLHANNWDVEIKKEYFEDTKSNQEILITKNIRVYKDINNLNIIIDDFKNKITWIKNKNIILSENISLSDIFINKNSEKGYEQILDSDVINLDTLWVNFYSPIESDTINISYNFFIHKEDNLDKEIIINFEENFIYDKDNYYPIPITTDFFNGLEIIIENSLNKKVKKIILERYEKNEYNYSIIVGPMEYILENSDFKKYREYTDLEYENKLIYIKDYWSVDEFNNDNKLFQELFNRVEYANNNYNYLSYEGWQTDRGKIFIINGNPYDIQNEYTADGEFEIWTYKNNRQYIFINKYGNYVLSTFN